MPVTDRPLAALAALEGVGSAYAAARDGIDVVLRDRGLRRTTPETTGESLLRGAHASAVLEGSGSSLEDVRSGAGDAVAQDALRVSTGLLSLVPLLGPSRSRRSRGSTRWRRPPVRPSRRAGRPTQPGPSGCARSAPC